MYQPWKLPRGRVDNDATFVRQRFEKRFRVIIIYIFVRNVASNYSCSTFCRHGNGARRRETERTFYGFRVYGNPDFCPSVRPSPPLRIPRKRHKSKRPATAVFSQWMNDAAAHCKNATSILLIVITR